jgi:flavin reductase (DIM6/NTAB) family NADH-FMN oxidoreductase RutF
MLLGGVVILLIKGSQGSMDIGQLATVWTMMNRELWLVTSQAHGQRGGLIATFVSQASIVPTHPRVLVGLAKHHHTWGLVMTSKVFTLHLLGEDQVKWVWQFGLRSGKDEDKFAGVDIGTSSVGCPLFKEAIAWLDCRVEATMATGDRTIFLAAVVDGGINRSGPALTMQRLINLAPKEKLAELREKQILDAGLDAQAIDEWRGESGFR